MLLQRRPLFVRLKPGTYNSDKNRSLLPVVFLCILQWLSEQPCNCSELRSLKNISGLGNISKIKSAGSGGEEVTESSVLQKRFKENFTKVAWKQLCRNLFLTIQWSCGSPNAFRLLFFFFFFFEERLLGTAVNFKARMQKIY